MKLASNTLTWVFIQQLVETKVTPQERNRVAIDFYINEGSTARIKEVKLLA